MWQKKAVRMLKGLRPLAHYWSLFHKYLEYLFFYWLENLNFPYLAKRATLHLMKPFNSQIKINLSLLNCVFQDCIFQSIAIIMLFLCHFVFMKLKYHLWDKLISLFCINNFQGFYFMPQHPWHIIMKLIINKHRFANMEFSNIFLHPVLLHKKLRRIFIFNLYLFNLGVYWNEVVVWFYWELYTSTLL